MKKLIFKALKLEETNILNRQQMRQIVGGYGNPCDTISTSICSMGCIEQKGQDWYCSSCCIA